MTDIKTLNDNFRKTFSGGRVAWTAGIDSMEFIDVVNIMEKVRNFNNFTKDNDPYGEHDFGSFEYKGQKIFWKIDYYDKDFCYMSEDPSNESKTNRVLTVMLADEY